MGPGRCNDASVAGKSECVGEYDAGNGTMVARDWHNQYPNFDNVGNSLLICFIVASLNGCVVRESGGPSTYNIVANLLSFMFSQTASAHSNGSQGCMSGGEVCVTALLNILR